MTEEKAQELLRTAVFQVAKTMPDIPHAYTLRKTWKDQNEFEALVQFIRDNGVKEKFGKSTYTYYYFEGHKYWSMGAPLKATILINRAKS